MRVTSPLGGGSIPIPSISTLNEHLLITLMMIHFHAFQRTGFDGCMHVVSVGVDPISQPDLLSTSETDQLINLVSVQKPGSL
jgi:hypothetical protein